MKHQPNALRWALERWVGPKDLEPQKRTYPAELVTPLETFRDAIASQVLAAKRMFDEALA